MIQNIKNKTDAELRRISDDGIGGPEIGVESGLNEALAYMHKGPDFEDSKEQLLRLIKAGIEYLSTAIPGCTGADLRKENADAAEDLN